MSLNAFFGSTTRQRVSGSTPPVDEYTYYVDADAGDDSNPGTSAQPFASIGATDALVSPGDSVYVRAATAHYRETPKPAVSGTSGNEIRYVLERGAIISGLNLVGNTGWSVYSGNIYQKTIAFPTRSTPDFDQAGEADQANEAMTNTNLLDYQVLKSGEMMIEARWPKGVQQYTDLLTLAATGSSTAPASTDTRRHTSDMVAFTTTQIQDNALNVSNGFPIASGGLVGAVVNTHGWFIAETRTITSHSGTTIGFSGIWNDDKVRKYYWLSGHLGLLTQQREFHYEGGVLYFWQAGGGSPTDVEYKARNWGFDLRDREYINITGGTFIGCEPVQGNTSTANCMIDNIRATHTNHTARLSRTYWQGYGTSQITGLKLVGANNVLKNSELSWGGSQAVWIGAGGTVDNNKIEYYGYDGMWGCGVSRWGEQDISNIIITNNSIGHMGRGCIDNGYAFSEDDVSRYTTDNEIGYNDFYDFCKLNQDGGAFYSWGWQNLSGCRIHHNWFHDHGAVPSPVPLAGGAGADGIMAAIYFDMGSGANVGQDPAIIDHNVCWNIGNGSGWIAEDWADLYSHPGLDQNVPGTYPDPADRIAKQPYRIYNNTFAGDRKSYVTYQNLVSDLQRNNIYRKEINQNWGGQAGDVANSTLMDVDPLFNGGSLTTPEIYFGLQAGSPSIDAGIVVAGITPASNVDTGAYERGETPWVPGYEEVAL